MAITLFKNTSLKHLCLDGNDGSLGSKLIKHELKTNKDPHKLQTKKERLVAWNPMKILLNASFDSQYRF